jgi:hypothetical protein
MDRQDDKRGHSGRSLRLVGDLPSEHFALSTSQCRLSVDYCARERLALIVDTSRSGARVPRKLDAVISLRRMRRGGFFLC